MRIELKETYEGEFEECPEELANKLERGVEQLRYVLHKSESSKDGRLHVIDELGELLHQSFEKRSKRLEKVILETLRDGGSDDN